jgi:hypothetical protein
VGAIGYTTVSSHKTCGELPARTQGLSNASEPGLRKLAQYEQICDGKPESRAGLFLPTPSTTEQAQAYAADTATTLEQYRQYGVSPLIFLEPATKSGDKLNLSAYAAGDYDSVLSAYFTQLKSNGVTDDELGLVTLLPEGNIPEWTSVDPGVYGAVVGRTASSLKAVFPSAKAAILLDSRTYPSNAYENPSYVSWEPYISTLPKGLIDSVGLQAYPEANNTDLDTYMRTDFLIEAAASLGVKDVWVSTGTYESLTEPSTDKVVHMSIEQREQILNQVAERMKAVRSKGYDTSVMLFAENKSTSAEQTNWSYWPQRDTNGPGVPLVQDFIQKLQANGLQFWVYDSYED